MEILREGAVADMSNDFATARARFEEALQTVPSGDLDGKAHIIIRCATALDNNRNSVEALSLLRPLLEEKQWHVLQPKIVKWLKYHVALAHRRIAESLEINDDVVTGNLDTADVLFKEVESTGETGQRIAATHQLGCVLWVRAAKAYAVRERTTLLEKAQGCFRQAAKKWQAAGNFREGYALRRLAEIAESQGEHVRAHNLLLDALEVFVRHDCYRYRDEVRRHLDRLVRAMSGTPLE
jgi:tetratricopeptide (TPR) repeat protein